jgi:DNA mismatch repair protein MutL
MNVASGRPGGGAIRVLPPEVAAQIAAGEVVERPVSVVRELLDNAIDARATRISVDVEGGGLDLIRVVDDGRGIAPADVEVAFERHATSKITALDDLARVRTLGFRGEALPSIAAAGDVELVTRVAAEPVGVMLLLVEGRVVRRSSRAAAVGTSITVRDLFARVPARRKFLGTAAGETRQVTVLVSHYALAYPGIAFHLRSAGRTSLQTPGDGDLRHAFATLHGPDVAQAMLAVDAMTDGVHVSGLAGPPQVHRGSRAALSVFVNGRWVQSRALTFAAADAYHDQLPAGRYPVAALAVSVPEDEVDVNVHPAKAEVRFRDERAVARAVRQAVRAALDGARVVSWPGVAVVGETDTVAAGPAPASRPGDDRPLRERPGVAALRPPTALQAALTLDRPSDAAPRQHRDVLPLLRVVGQLGLTYIVAEGPDGMYLVDQHAAHERVVFDRIVAQRAETARRDVQPLLDPVLIDLAPALLAVVDEFRAHLERLGLHLEPFGDGTVLVRGVPAGVGGDGLGPAIRELLDQLANEARVTDPFERAAATVACHSSVRAGQPLAIDEMRRLLEDLERTAAPRTCPHGRPTLVHMGTEAIERQFGRR